MYETHVLSFINAQIFSHACVYHMSYIMYLRVGRNHIFCYVVYILVHRLSLSLFANSSFSVSAIHAYAT